MKLKEIDDGDDDKIFTFILDRVRSGWMVVAWPKKIRAKKKIVKVFVGIFS